MHLDWRNATFVLFKARSGYWLKNIFNWIRKKSFLDFFLNFVVFVAFLL